MSAIEDKYAALGGQSSLLGIPIGSESSTQDGIGRFRDFQFGSIYWTSQTDAHEIHGAIREKWVSLGRNANFLGYPTSDETQTADASWCFNHFQNGSILWPRIGWPAQPGAQSYRAGKSGAFGTASPKWGLLASSGFDSQPMKSTYFFAGNWRFGIHKFYEYFACPNDFLYTIHPSDARHLGWSEQLANREFALDAMTQAGVNVINLSYWGKRGTDRWSFWAPMHSSTFAHDEVFNAAIGKNILIAPYIEDCIATDYDPKTGQPFQCGTDELGHTGNSPGYSFADDFPGTPTDPAPALVEQLLDLVDRYLINPQNQQWPGKWAQMYDQDGEKRHVVSLIHARSNQSSINDQIFAAGLDSVADKVLATTGIKVGFTLDPFPDSSKPYNLTPTAGLFLAQTKSFLAIQAFISEIAFNTSEMSVLIPKKQHFINSWLATRIPFFLDVSTGYDAHIMYPPAVRYGNNEIWRNGQTQMIVSNVNQNFVRGITFNTRNGYTEGYAAVPTLEYGNAALVWLQSLFQLLP